MSTDPVASGDYPTLPDGHTPDSFAAAVMAKRYAADVVPAQDCATGDLVVSQGPLQAGTYLVETAGPSLCLLASLSPARPDVKPAPTQVVRRVHKDTLDQGEVVASGGAASGARSGGAASGARSGGTGSGVVSVRPDPSGSDPSE